MEQKDETKDRSKGKAGKKASSPKDAFTNRMWEMQQKERLNLVIDKDLKEFAKDYARRHDTTVTNLIKEFLRKLREDEVRQF